MNVNFIKGAKQLLRKKYGSLSFCAQPGTEFRRRRRPDPVLPAARTDSSRRAALLHGRGSLFLFRGRLIPFRPFFVPAACRFLRLHTGKDLCRYLQRPRILCGSPRRT